MGARYTEGELASVREMVAGGMTDGEIAERLGRTPSGIASARWIHGILGKLGEVAASVRR